MSQNENVGEENKPVQQEQAQDQNQQESAENQAQPVTQAQEVRPVQPEVQSGSVENQEQTGPGPVIEAKPKKSTSSKSGKKKEKKTPKAKPVKAAKVEKVAKAPKAAKAKKYDKPGRPAVFNEDDQKLIVALVAEFGLTETANRLKEKGGKFAKISLPTIGKFAKAAGVVLKRGPRQVEQPKVA